MSGTTQESAPSVAGPARVRVYEWLRDEIIKGTIEPGRFLDEVWVSESVGVSRTPVREAFHQLAAERFITLLPRKGAQVRTVTTRELEEVYESRLLIEGHAISQICARGHGAPPEMRNILDQMGAAVKLSDWFAVSALDRNFHRTMVTVAGNSVLTELYDLMRSRQQRVAVRALTVRPERTGLIDQEHRALVDALSNNDAEGALKVLKRHLLPVTEIIALLPAE
jgi:DNA-binding GntR family transcriptional regulator